MYYEEKVINPDGNWVKNERNCRDGYSVELGKQPFQPAGIKRTK
jgi:hypothetical protein